jgi:hypothetical protein
VLAAGWLADSWLGAAATDVSGVKLLGVIIGGLLLIAAIRGMFGPRNGKRRGKR